MRRPHKDIAGQRFGRLVAIEYLGKSLWLCKCDCGNTSTPKSWSLRSGTTQSCGCLHKEIVGKKSTKHGLGDTRIYSIWRNMKQRCNNPNATKYEIYGGKGIKVCNEWLDFNNFYKWATENGYEDSLSIDRIDGNKDYTPDNCRWTTYQVQANNTTQNHYLTHIGKTQTISGWAEEIGIEQNTLNTRIARGWSVEKALTTKPINKLKRDKKGRFLSE